MNLKDKSVTLAQQSATLKADVEEFVANGGIIEQIPEGRISTVVTLNPKQALK